MRRGRRIAFDPGSVRIGVAVCDPDGILARLHEPVAADDGAALRELIAEVEPIEIVNACFGGLQQPDEPLPDAGYERLFYFCTYTCRKAITARMGADSLANFTKHTELSPAIQPFTRAASIRIVEEPTIIAGTPTRGPMATVGVDVFIAPSFRHASGYEKESDAPEALRFAIRLQQERRPPKNWLITEILDTRFAFAGDTGNDLQ